MTNGTEDQVREDQVKEDQVETKSAVVDVDHPPGAVIVGDGGSFPEYRHGRESKSDVVDHPLGDQPEGVVEDPVTYPPDELPPVLESGGTAGTSLEEEATGVHGGGTAEPA